MPPPRAPRACRTLQETACPRPREVGAELDSDDTGRLVGPAPGEEAVGTPHPAWPLVHRPPMRILLGTRESPAESARAATSESDGQLFTSVHFHSDEVPGGEARVPEARAVAHVVLLSRGGGT